MKVQDYLRTPGNNLETLEKELGIEATLCEQGRLVILNYSQIKSPKRDPIVIECRGLVLEIGTWNVVARAFPRFFNMGECPDTLKRFDWDSAHCMEKCDGSLALLYFYNNEWRMNTRGSFAKGQVHPSEKLTWEEYFWSAFSCPNEELKDFITSRLPKKYTYVFELCGLLNKVVRRYEKTTVYLLTIYDNETGEELNHDIVDNTAEHLGVYRPLTYQLRDPDEVNAFVNHEDNHQTFEGVVLRDKWGERIKCKSPRYVSLHHLRGQGDQDLLNPKNLIPFILGKPEEKDELLAVFAECKPAYEKYEKIINDNTATMLDVWDRAKNIESQKDFALFIKDKVHSVIAGFLFQARKLNKNPLEILKESPDAVLKMVKSLLS